MPTQATKLRNAAKTTGLDGIVDLLNQAADALEADEQKALAMEVLRLKGIIGEVHSWIVCGCITSAEDMMGNAERITEITGPDFDGEAGPVQ